MDVIWFKDIDEQIKNEVGLKAVKLAFLKKNLINVPDGFVISSSFFQKYLEQTGLKEKIKNVIDQTSCDFAAITVQNMIVTTPMPLDMVTEIRDNYELLGTNVKKASEIVSSMHDFVAIRGSSVDLENSGNGVKFLNIKGDVVAGILACWASLFSYSSIKNGANQDSSLPVIVQKMVKADTAGKCAVNNFVIVKGGYGHNSFCDSYILDKKSREILTRNIGCQIDKVVDDGRVRVEDFNQKRQKVNDSNLKEISRVSEKVSNLLGNSQEVSWSMIQDEVFVFGSKKID
jgi:pyruvate,water dikinase